MPTLLRRPRPLEITASDVSTAPSWLDDAQGAWLALEPEVSVLERSAAGQPRVDLQAAAELVLKVVRAVRGDEALLARLRWLSSGGELDAGLLDRVERVGLAAWYARHRQLDAEVTRTKRSVPELVVTRALELRDRMHCLAVYHLGDHPTIGRALARMTRRRDLRRLANDLVTLAELYTTHAGTVAADPKRYVATDAREAHATSDEIRRALGAYDRDEHTRWTARCAVLWMWLWRDYSELLRTGHWLLRASPAQAERTFPSPVVHARRAPRARAGTAVAADAPAANTGMKRRRRGR